MVVFIWIASRYAASPPGVAESPGWVEAAVAAREGAPAG
jgi:hypothetical protein